MLKNNTRNLPVRIVLFLAIIYLIFLAFSIHHGAFFAGDQALKELQARQIAAGYGFKYLHFLQPQWVQETWKAGYFPLRPPFVYPSPDGYLIVYPPLFQIVSSWFYAVFGWSGLYIIPIGCTLLLLTWITNLLRQTGASPLNIAVSLFILVFCSPLFLYGVMFWEHLPAVLMLFAGVHFIVLTPTRWSAAAALGIITGCAVWLRPESLMMNFLYCATAAVLYLRERRSVCFAFVCFIALSTLSWMIFNKLEYGSVAGIHGNQVLYDHINDSRLSSRNGWSNLIDINHISLNTFCFSLFLFPVVYRMIRRKDTADRRILLLAAIVILFSLLAPFMLPNNGVVQWGARYFLAIVPVTIVVLSTAATKWSLTERWSVPVWLTICLVIAGLQSFYRNTHDGGYKELRWRYTNRIAGPYHLIDSRPGNVVIVSHQWMTNDFADLFDKDYFFAASGDDSLSRLIPILRSHGVHQFIYIFDPRVPSLPPMLKDPTTSHWWVDAAKKTYTKEDFVAKVYPIQ